MTTARTFSLSGFLLAIASAASFALSGIFASALITAGWSPGAATTVRITLAALVLAVPTIVQLRGKWGLVLRAWRVVLLFGLIAITVVQLAFFFAVRFIAPSLALLIEFMGPVLLILWFWLRTRKTPSGITLLGAALAVLGLVAISGVGFGSALDPVGIAFGLTAAVGVAVYFALGAKADHGIPPIPLVGLGLMIGSVILVGVSAIGLLPFTVSSAPPVIAGAEVPAWLVVAGLVLVSTALAYVLGVSAARRLGATVASFTGYSEPLFGIAWTILLLAIMPTGMQWAGAALIIAGVVTVKIGELDR